MSASELGKGIRKLCEPCAKDTAVYGRCERLERINRPGTICDRCLSDGRLLVSYRVCCEPERRHGHTDECRKTRKRATDPVLQRFAVALFSTDSRVLALVGQAFGGVFDASSGQCLAVNSEGRVDSLGKAWDLAADGHEPEATYRKEAEDRAFRMQAFDRELSRYAAETKRLTRESYAQAAVRNVAKANEKLPGPLPHAEHLANVATHKAAEAEQNRLYSLRELQQREAEDQRKREERAARRGEYVDGYARVTTKDPAPLGDLIVRVTPDMGARVLGSIEKDSIVAVLSDSANSGEFVRVHWRGGSRLPSVAGYVLKRYLALESGSMCLGNTVRCKCSRHARQLEEMRDAKLLPPHYPLTDGELNAIALLMSERP